MGENSSESPQEAWVRIKSGVDKILAPPESPLDASEFMKCYTTIHNFCSKSEPDAVGFDAMNINIGGKEIYYFLKQHLEDFLLLQVKNQPGEETLLDYYCRKWRAFTRSAVTLHNLFNYLNRMWIKRKLDEQVTGIFDIYTLCLISWRDCLFAPLHQRILSAILKQIHMERKGERIDRLLLQQIINSFGIDIFNCSNSWNR
jgi:cullin 1